MLERFLYFFVHYGVLALIVATALLVRPRSRLTLLAATALGLALVLFLWFWGQWPLVGSYYLRYLTVVVAVLLGWGAWRAWNGSLPWLPRGMARWVSFIVATSLLALVARLDLAAVRGLTHDVPMVDLEFPLREGVFYISSGGASKVLNNHMRNPPNPQEYALDVSKLGRLGGASINPLVQRNEHHHIFGEPVYSPCAGRVTEAANHVPDHAGPSMEVAPEDGPGNRLIIACDKATIFLSHLRHGSVEVSAGESVAAGQRVGAVGNSGFSEEPHLHFQASVPDPDGNLVGIPMRFGSRTLVRNDRHRAD